MKDKDWSEYQSSTYNDKVSNLLLKFLNEYQITDAVDLGCGAGNETVFMLKKGIHVTACDKQLNKDFINNRLTKDLMSNVAFLEGDFSNIDIPKSQAICAFFSIPFCNPKEFNNLWNKIYDSLEYNGYFAGQLFGDRDDFSNRVDINTFNYNTVKEYLKKYEVLLFEEVEFTSITNNKKWHYYDIIARKKEIIEEV